MILQHLELFSLLSSSCGFFLKTFNDGAEKFDKNQKDNLPTDKTANIDLGHGRFSAQEDRSNL